MWFHFTTIKIKPTEGQLSGCCSSGSFLKVLTCDFPSFSRDGNALLSHPDTCFIPEQDQHPSAESGGEGGGGGQANLGVLRSRILCRDGMGINERSIVGAAHNPVTRLSKGTVVGKGKYFEVLQNDFSPLQV